MARGAVVEVEPRRDAYRWLPEADFADAYRAEGPAGLTAEAAARLAAENPSGWVRALMGLRNALVRPFGLKTGEGPERGEADRIGIFPVIDRSPERVVMGLDDRHLDFRLVVDARAVEAATAVTVTTLVRTHNRLGRGYLALIKPFHRLIVRRMTARIARN